MPHDDLPQRRREAIDALYRAFAAPVPRVIPGCPCCANTRRTDDLLMTPLRAIDGMMAWRYVSGVFLTVGGVADFRYLLPRILDIALNDPMESNPIEVVLGKLRLAGWATWPEAERAAVVAVIDALFDTAVERGLDDPDDPSGTAGEVEAVLCGAARAGLDPWRWLERLRSPGAARVLDDLRRRVRPTATGFWEDAAVGHALVLHWLGAPADS